MRSPTRWPTPWVRKNALRLVRTIRAAVLMSLPMAASPSTGWRCCREGSGRPGSRFTPVIGSRYVTPVREPTPRTALSRSWNSRPVAQRISPRAAPEVDSVGDCSRRGAGPCNLVTPRLRIHERTRRVHTRSVRARFHRRSGRGATGIGTRRLIAACEGTGPFPGADPPRGCDAVPRAPGILRRCVPRTCHRRTRTPCVRSTRRTRVERQSLGCTILGIGWSDSPPRCGGL